MDRKGRENALAAAASLAHHLDGWPDPTHILSSDLRRATETASVVAQVLGTGTVKTMPELRAYEPKRENPEQYEERSAVALDRIMAGDGVPVIVAHRSTSAYLGRIYSRGRWTPDYRSDSLLREGGILAITPNRLVPLYKAIRTTRDQLGGASRQPTVAAG